MQREHSMYITPNILSTHDVITSKATILKLLDAEVHDLMPEHNHNLCLALILAFTNQKLHQLSRFYRINALEKMFLHV